MIRPSRSKTNKSKVVLTCVDDCLDAFCVRPHVARIHSYWAQATTRQEDVENLLRQLQAEKVFI